MSIYIEETYLMVEPYVNEYGDTDYRYIKCGDSGVHETRYDDVGKLFRALQKENGRCTGKIYHDNHDDAIGWAFMKRATYEDTGEPYLAETWVTLHTAEPTRKISYNYQTISN